MTFNNWRDPMRRLFDVAKIEQVCSCGERTDNLVRFDAHMAVHARAGQRVSRWVEIDGQAVDRKPGER